MRYAKQLPIGGRDLRFEVETIRTKKNKAETESRRNLYLGVRAIGVLALLTLAAITWIQLTRNFDPRTIADVEHSPYHLKYPVIAIEFIQTPEQLNAILGKNSEHNRQELLADIRHDYFFIAAYALLYIALSMLLAYRHQRRWAIYLAWVAAICGIGAALFDVKENMAIVSLLNAPDQPTVSAIHFAATVKWTLSFVTAAILALNFYASDGWLLVVGYALRLTALLGFVGLWYLPLLPFTVGPMLPALVLLLIRALFQPMKFIDEL
jgi:hypothetical protein